MFERKGKTFVDIRIGETPWGESERVVRIRIADVANYFRYEAPNISSGCRTLAGIVGDWRPIDNLAQDVLSYFKDVNVEGMRREGRKLGLEPRF
jgi:hypothetical protein